MSAATTLQAESRRYLDVLGIEIFIGDRVALVTETRFGLERICAGIVVDFDGDRVHWISDPMSEEEWKRLTWGASITSSGGAYAPPKRSNRDDHFSRPSALKVVGRAKGARS